MITKIRLGIAGITLFAAGIFAATPGFAGGLSLDITMGSNGYQQKTIDIYHQINTETDLFIGYGQGKSNFLPAGNNYWMSLERAVYKDYTASIDYFYYVESDDYKYNTAGISGSGKWIFESICIRAISSFRSTFFDQLRETSSGDNWLHVRQDNPEQHVKLIIADKWGFNAKYDLYFYNVVLDDLAANSLSSRASALIESLPKSSYSTGVYCWLSEGFKLGAEWTYVYFVRPQPDKDSWVFDSDIVLTDSLLLNASYTMVSYGNKYFSTGIRWFW